MGKGAKIAIGCVVVLVLGMIVVVAGIGGLAWWSKGKLQQLTRSEDKVQELRKQADQNVFVAPADGVIDEQRLLKFIEVRKRVFAVYDQHRELLEAKNKGNPPDLGDMGKAIGALGEARTAQAQALADLGMSTAEYAFLVQAIYKGAWAAGVAQASGGKTTSEVAGAALEAARKQLEAAGTPEAAKALEDLRAAAEQAKLGDAPPANVELVRKHRAELEKYAMAGLELVGL